MAGENHYVHKSERLLQSHFLLEDGNVMVMVGNEHLRGLSTKHQQIYGNVFLFMPWESEEGFLCEARQSEEAYLDLW